MRGSIKSIGGTFLGRGFTVASIVFPGVSPFFSSPCCESSLLPLNTNPLFMSFAGDWNSSYLSAANTVKRRISLFTKEGQKRINEARRMRGLADLSAMMATQLGLPSVEPSGPSSEVVVTDTIDASVRLLRPTPPPLPLRRRRARRDLATILLLARISRLFPRVLVLPTRLKLLNRPRRREKRSSRAIDNIFRRRTLRPEVLRLLVPLFKLARLSSHLSIWL